MNRDRAEQIAVDAFGFLAREPEYFAIFSTQTGIDPADLAAIADTPAFLDAVLGFLLSDEAMLLTFCQNSGQQPEDVNLAHLSLGGSDAIC
jgi:hypothetical protein